MSKLLVVVLVAVLAVAVLAKKWDLNQDPKVLWQQWLSYHPHVLKLSPEKLAKRFAIFKKNILKMIEWNKKHPEEKLSLGPHSHVTDVEFLQFRTGSTPNAAALSNAAKSAKRAELEELDISALPKSIDWRAKKKVAPIKNQGGCGSCWAFASVSAIESAWAISGKKLVKGSQQQLVDCVRDCKGCSGGWMGSAIDYAARVGLKTAKSYPYKARKGSCRTKGGIAAKPKGSYQLPQKAYTTLLTYIATKGPLSIAVHVNSKWMHYKSGIITPGSGCSSKPGKANHAVNIVGYGRKGGKAIWIVRNSWGTTWGYKGYALLRRGKTSNTCGIHNWPIAATV